MVISHVIYSVFYNETIVRFLGNDLQWIPIAMMVLGGLLIFITFLGGFGAMKESSTMVFVVSTKKNKYHPLDFVCRIQF